MDIRDLQITWSTCLVLWAWMESRTVAQGQTYSILLYRKYSLYTIIYKEGEVGKPLVLVFPAIYPMPQVRIF